MTFLNRPKCSDCEVILFYDEIEKNGTLCHRCKDFRDAMLVEHTMNSSDAAGGEGK
jgi:acetyl-CoA carboxylase beta subunit